MRFQWMFIINKILSNSPTLWYCIDLTTRDLILLIYSSKNQNNSALPKLDRGSCWFFSINI